VSRWSLALAFAAGLLGGCAGADRTTGAPAHVEQPAAPADPLEGLDADVDAVMQMFETPGLALVIVKDDEVLVSKGYGTRTLGKDEPVDGDTVFAIASNTKAFIATSIGLLVADGTIGWDDRVIEHLPDLVLWDEYTTQHIRVRDLLCHRSGLATWAGDTAWIGSDLTTEELMARLRHVPPDHDFREAYGYTNLMFVVAGEVIRAKTGKPWEDFVQTRLLDPLGMQRTTTTVTALAKMDDVATPYMEIDGKQTAIEYLSVDNASAPGALNSSVNDLARWLRTQLADGQFEGKQVVPAEVVEKLRVPHTPIPRKASDETGHFSAYGLGWFLQDRHGAFLVTHGGGLPGMISRVTLVPDENLGVAVLTNSESPAAALVSNIVVDRFLGVDTSAELEQAKRRAAAPSPPEETSSGGETAPPSVAAATLAGGYVHPLLGRALVTEDDGGLKLSLPDHGGLDCPLRHLDGDVYDCEWDNPIFGSSSIQFDVEDGVPEAFRFRVRPEFIDPLEYRFERKKARKR
jgi:CubicO group peptidase (beta-lactamase class C family)